MIARFTYWWLTVIRNNDTKEWAVTFNDGTPSWYGWDAILDHIAASGWEIISVSPERYDTYHPSEEGYQYVTRYRVICKKPV